MYHQTIQLHFELYNLVATSCSKFVAVGKTYPVRRSYPAIQCARFLGCLRQLQANLYR